MKLSELKIEDVLGMTMHENEDDCLRTVHNQQSLDDIRGKLMEKFGDVDITINPEHSQVRITSENWVSAHKAYCDKKAEAMARWGCE